MQHLVFVYGSLLTGLHNHCFLAGAACRGASRTVERCWLLLDLGGFPGVIVSAGPGRGRVCGEVYQVDDSTLAALDALEGQPRHYKREQVRLESGEWAWMYVYQRAQGKKLAVVPDGDWKTYVAQRSCQQERRARC